MKVGKSYFIAVIVMVVLLFFTCNAFGQLKNCGPQVQTLILYTAAPEDWASVHKAYVKFSRCDDRINAQTFSDLIVHLLATKWNRLNSLNVLAKKDPAFYKFVFRHIDAATDEKELGLISSNTIRRCPKNLSKLCADINKASKAAINDAEKVH